MQIIAVMNPKGGVGKSTVSTNLAGLLASQGHKVMLGDIDLQQTSKKWLASRPANLRAIHTWDVGSKDGVRSICKPPAGTTHVVLDTPAGLFGERLNNVLNFADKVIVPLQPSIFDIEATHDFLEMLASKFNEPNSSSTKRLDVGIVGMRVNARTHSANSLRNYVFGLSLPVLGYLRDTQNYVHLAANGATLWDVAPSKVESDLEQWTGIINWLA